MFVLLFILLEKKSSKFLTLLLAKTYRKANKVIKKGWDLNERVDSKTSHTLGNVNKTVAILVHI